MNATCTHSTNGAIRRTSRCGSGAGSPCRYGAAAASEPDDVVALVTSGEPMSVAELVDAAAFLGRYARAGRMDVLVARVRVAVRLEQLGV